MEIIELSIICMTVVVSVGVIGLVWLKIKATEETEKNYREELRAQRRGNVSPTSRDSDDMSELIKLVLPLIQQNPQMIQNILGGLAGGGSLPPKE